MLVVIASGKGGVGKSSTTIALGAALRELGRDPLLLDLDPGADLTWSLGFDAGDGAREVIDGRRTATDATIESTEGLRLVAGGPSLVGLEALPVAQLADRLRSIAEAGLVIADTAPGFASILTRAAIVAADVVIVPFVPEPNAERRARHILDVAGALGIEPTILALAVMVEPRRSLTGAILDQAREGGLDPIAEVPRSVVVPESANVGRSVLDYAPRSPVAVAYREAAKALLKAASVLGAGK